MLRTGCRGSGVRHADEEVKSTSESEIRKLVEKVARLEQENKALLADLQEADLQGCYHCKNRGQDIVRSYHFS